MIWPVLACIELNFITQLIWIRLSDCNPNEIKDLENYESNCLMIVIYP